MRSSQDVPAITDKLRRPTAVYKHATLLKLLAKRRADYLRGDSHRKGRTPIFLLSTAGGKYVVNGNPHTLFLSLLPFLLPEQWEEPKGRSFHSASTVVILEETGREREGEGGGRCVVVDRERERDRARESQRERAREGQIEIYASVDPLVDFLNYIKLAGTIYLSSCTGLGA